jgi:hypothetical protein
MAHGQPPVWNVGAAVGFGKPNRPDDVGLVRRMLLALAAGGAAFTPPAVPLPRDGPFDATLSAWIRAFQTALARQSPGKFVVDGIVSPMPSPVGPDWSAKFPSGALSTLAAMNISLRQRNRAAHSQAGAGLVEKLGP